MGDRGGWREGWWTGAVGCVLTVQGGQWDRAADRQTSQYQKDTVSMGSPPPSRQPPCCGDTQETPHSTRVPQPQRRAATHPSSPARVAGRRLGYFCV